MAPLTRSNALADREGLSQRPRETSWQFVGGSESEREESVEPGSSYDSMELSAQDNGVVDDEMQDGLETSMDDNEDILHPLREAANRVGREVERFAQVLDQYNPLSSSKQVEKYEMTIELINQYHEIAVETYGRLKNQHGVASRLERGASNEQEEDEMYLEENSGKKHSGLKTTVEDRDRWEEEVNTWDLLRRLVRLRFSHPSAAEKDSTLAAAKRSQIHRYSTDLHVWEDFLQNDDLAFERKTVLDWLKSTAAESGEDINDLMQDHQQNADRGEVVAHGWLYTKSALKNMKRLNSWNNTLDPTSKEVLNKHWSSNGTRPLILHLDPDATTRQDRKLEVSDEYFERATWLGCYEMLRRGTSQADMKEWLENRTEVWRAVSMSGFPDERSQTEEEAGNPISGALWKRMCFALAKKGGGDDYERAVYGILSGDIDSVLKVCTRWDDHIFAHYNALLRTQFDNYVQQRYPTQGPAFDVCDAIQYHSQKDLIESLKGKEETKKEAMRPMKMLQGVLIANKFEDFIYNQGIAFSKFANQNEYSTLIPAIEEQPAEDIERYISNVDHDSMRVVTHMLLIFIGLGLDLGGPKTQVVIENVIVAYVKFLGLAGKEELIPLYCSQLTGNRRYSTLSRTLIDVTDPSQRLDQIRLMRGFGLDVQEFVRYQSRYLFADHPDHENGYPATGSFNILEDDPLKMGERRIKRDFFGSDDDVLERADILLVRSLEWYLLVDGLWSETFLVGTLLYLRFFKHMHLNAARLLAGKVSSASIALSKTGKILGRTMDFNSLDSDGEEEDFTEVINESAEDIFYLKKHLVAEAKSFRELEALTEFLDMMESCASSFDLLLGKNVVKNQRDCRNHLASCTQSLKDPVQPLLKGWLLTHQHDGAEKEFKQLREAYLTECILAYVNVLQVAGRLLSRDLIMECMDLSSVIAAEGSDVLELFVESGRVGELVSMFAQAGQELLIVTSQKAPKSASKRLRSKGWTPELWSVKT